MRKNAINRIKYLVKIKKAQRRKWTKTDQHKIFNPYSIYESKKIFTEKG